jgi:hypothetical protein
VPVGHTPSSEPSTVVLHNGILHLTDGPLNNTWRCIRAAFLRAKQCCLIRNEHVRTTEDTILPSHSQCDGTLLLCFSVSGSRNGASVEHVHAVGVNLLDPSGNFTCHQF